MLSRFVMAFLPRRKCLLILWLQSLSTVMLDAKKIKSVTVSTFSPSICHEIDGMKWSFSECWVLSQLFHSAVSALSRGSLIPLPFLPLVWYHLHIWSYWYFSHQSNWCASSSWAFCMMYSAYKLNKPGWQYTALTHSFPNLEPVCCSMASSNYCFFTCIQVS